MSGMKNMLARYRENGLLVFLVLYLVFYTTDAAGGYFMIYLNSIGFNTLQMGILTAVAALTAMLFQPFIGRMADRARTKNGVLIVTLLSAACIGMMLRLSKGFIYIMLVYTGYLILRNTQRPLVDTITLEYADAKGADFGPIRTMGCIGYALMAAYAGRVADVDPANTFVLFTAASLASVLVVLFLPKSYGMQRGKKRVSPMVIFNNRRLLAYTLLAMVLASTKSFYHNFFSVYFTRELGGSANLYGILLSVAAFMEIPVIFLIDRLNRRFGVRSVIIAAGLIAAAHLAITAMVVNPTAQIVIQSFFGLNNMTLSLSMTIFVNEAMSPELKATGQATYSMCTNVASLLIGNLLGGAASNLLGIRAVLVLCVMINVIAVGLFALRGRRNGRAVMG